MIAPASNNMNGIEHLIVLMMENRSFDHVLGSLTTEGMAGIDGIATPPAEKPAEDGTMIAQAPITSTDFNYNIPHDRPTMLAQYSGGTFDNFVTTLQAKGVEPSLAMGYYGKETFPVLHALANEFTVCDAWFASILSSTWPNRKFFHSGTCDGDDDTQTLPGFPGFRTTPLYAALEKTIDPNRGAGHFLSWRCYFSDLPFLAFWYEFAALHALTNFSHVAQFVEDCRQGTLPTLSVIDPPYTLADDHPPHDPKLGEKFIGLVVDALTTSQSWPNSALLIVYDENGGFFDHAGVRTLATPNPFGDTFTGMRVPAILVSPFSKKGASHTVYDHTSLMKSVKARWNVQFDDRFGDRWTTASDFWDCLATATARDLGIYTGDAEGTKLASLDWGSGVYDRLGGELGAFESLLERIFVLPELKALDQRANVFDILGDLEHKVITQKRMYTHKPPAIGAKAGGGST